MAVVPLALMSAAWTAHLLSGAGPAVGAAVAGPTTAPTTVAPVDPRVLSSAPVDDVPASVSRSPEVAAASDDGFVPVAATTAALTSDIPAPALAAYQRAETVINAADKSCHLSWQLVAALGRVESDHGRFGGSAFTADGAVNPAILGPLLDGSTGSSVIRDTDAGELDGNSAYDRAVGPMQFIPSTWSVVGVDADNDGVRNPQDIDDAALAAAVYLCSGGENLDTESGQRGAVYRYNHSDAYVDNVLSIMNAYLEGDVASTPPPTISAGSLVPLPAPPVLPAPDVEVVYFDLGRPANLTVEVAHAIAPTFGPPMPVDPPAPTTEPTKEPTDPTDEPGEDPTEEPGGDPTDDPTEEPTGNPSGEPTTDDPTQDPTTDPSDDPTQEPSDEPAQDLTQDPTDDPTEEAVGTMTPDEAAAFCTDEELLVDDPESEGDDYDLCVLANTDPAYDGDEPAEPLVAP